MIIIDSFLNALTSNLNPRFISAYYHDLTNVCWNNAVTKNSFNVFYLILSGEGHINVMGKDYFPVKSQLVLIPCNKLHFAKTINNNHYIKYSCYFSSQIEQYDLFEILNTPVCVDIKEIDELILLFKKMCFLFQKPDKTIADEIQIKSLILKLISVYFDNCPPESIKRYDQRDYGDIEAAIRYIDKHIYDTISVDTLANLCGYHPNYFHRLFKTVTGETPIRYINKIRLKKMVDCILYSDMSISDIANNFNISSKTFNSIISKNYGLSPGKLRKNHINSL